MEEAERDEVPNYSALVERELRIADNLVHVQKLYDEIFGPQGLLGIEGRRQQYLKVRRNR